MQGGTGEGSYARNSQAQASAFGDAAPLLREAVKSLAFVDERVIRIADLGCSTGPNTLSVIKFVVKCLQEKRPALDLDRAVEYQAFFSDLPSNDFNTLFRNMLPPIDGNDIRASDEGPTAAREYYAAGVPGSFYERQFPKASLHAVMSFSSLHWLSKVPEAVKDPNSPAWNKGAVSIDHAELPAIEAFAQQAKEDLQAFLKSRAEEMVSGGLLFLLFLGRKDHSHPEIQWPSTDTQSSEACDVKNSFAAESLQTWNDLISEGLITAETRDAFNLPTFHRSLIEVEEAVKENECFEIQMLQQKSGSWFSPADREKWASDHKSFAKMWNNFAKSTVGKLIDAHLGDPQLTDIFFQRHEANAMKLATQILSPRHYYIVNMVSLIRI